MGSSRVWDVLVVGGGAVGLWAALDLAGRGVSVLLVERSTLASEASSKYHGLLHSGARYAVVDPVSARECIEENRVISRVAGHAVEDTGGYYVAVTEADERYYEEFAEALGRVGIPHREVPVGEALREEPEVNRAARVVVEVPDKVVYARELMVSIALSAYRRGAALAEAVELVRLRPRGETVEAVLRDRIGGGTVRVEARVVLNAAGPWAARVARMAGVEGVEVAPTAGAVLVYAGRLTRRVVNRMRRPSDGDIVVPYGHVSLAGTTAYPIADPDSVTVRDEDFEIIAREAATLLPRLRDTPVLRAFASVRPLVPGGARSATRSYRVHVAEEPVRMVSVVGGKLTTARLVAEKASDAVADLLGVRRQSQTATTPLDGADPYEELEELRPLPPYARLLASELSESMDSERGRIAAYMLIEYVVASEGRRALGLGVQPLPSTGSASG